MWYVCHTRKRRKTKISTNFGPMPYVRIFYLFILFFILILSLSFIFFNFGNGIGWKLKQTQSCKLLAIKKGIYGIAMWIPSSCLHVNFKELNALSVDLDSNNMLTSSSFTTFILISHAKYFG